MAKRKILITGGAGFIGSNLIDELISNTEYEIVCVDNFDDYYPAEIKMSNLEGALQSGRVHLIREDICRLGARKELDGVEMIVHLAAKAGVRPSIQNPGEYVRVNVLGTQNLLELAREMEVKHFVFGSSSSVYGVNPNYPWVESDNVLQPISPYAATKISGELLGSVYANLYDIRFIGLRFFTVYGPRQRPDLAINKFIRKAMSGDSIEMYGDGDTKRDYTYVSDIVSGIRAAMDYTASKYEIFNLGSNNPVELKELVSLIEAQIGAKVKVEHLSEQPGDVPITYADIAKSAKLLGYRPKVTIAEGIKKYFEWLGNCESGSGLVI